MPFCGAYVVVQLTGLDDECREIPIGWSLDVTNAVLMAATLERKLVRPPSLPVAVSKGKRSRKRATIDWSLIPKVMAEIRAFGGIRQSLSDVFSVDAVSAGYPGSMNPDFDPTGWDRVIEHLDTVAGDSIDAQLRKQFREMYPDVPLPYATAHARKVPQTDPLRAEAIDEYDVAVLAFLDRTRGLRRKISDVLPDKGPQDRKAVAKRLRKLADRTPPLVDYPKGGRLGAAILPAGTEELQRVTSPTPR